MRKPVVSIVRYESPLESVRKAVDLAGALNRLPSGARVFIKPNVVFWTRAVAFPKWGVITTSRVVEDMVVLLKERGAARITIGEGVVTADPKDREAPAHAFETLGYRKLEKRYGVRLVNVMERPFKMVGLGDDMTLKFSTDILECDFVVDLPVMKAHNQTVVSLGIKNLKGTIDIPSRKNATAPTRTGTCTFGSLAWPTPCRPCAPCMTGFSPTSAARLLTVGCTAAT